MELLWVEFDEEDAKVENNLNISRFSFVVSFFKFKYGNCKKK